MSIRYQFPLGDYISYGGNIGRVEMVFTGPQKGTYRIYDITTDEYKSSGAFTIDDNAI